jgi:hypothetical protein
LLAVDNFSGFEISGEKTDVKLGIENKKFSTVERKEKMGI